MPVRFIPALSLSSYFVPFISAVRLNATWTPTAKLPAATVPQDSLDVCAMSESFGDLEGNV